MANAESTNLKDYFTALANNYVLARRFFFVMHLGTQSWKKEHNALIKDVNIPGISLQSASFNSTSELTDMALSYTFVAPGTYAPTRKEFEVKFLDTENSILDSLFYPWMLGAMSSTKFKDAYATNMSIDFYNNKATSIALTITATNVYPITVDTPNASHNNQGVYERGVTFRCDSLLITKQSISNSNKSTPKIDSGSSKTFTLKSPKAESTNSVTNTNTTTPTVDSGSTYKSDYLNDIDTTSENSTFNEASNTTSSLNQNLNVDTNLLNGLQNGQNISLSETINQLESARSKSGKFSGMSDSELQKNITKLKNTLKTANSLIINNNIK